MANGQTLQSGCRLNTFKRGRNHAILLCFSIGQQLLIFTNYVLISVDFMFSKVLTSWSAVNITDITEFATSAAAFTFITMQIICMSCLIDGLFQMHKSKSEFQMKMGENGTAHMAYCA